MIKRKLLLILLLLLNMSFYFLGSSDKISMILRSRPGYGLPLEQFWYNNKNMPYLLTGVRFAFCIYLNEYFSYYDSNGNYLGLNDDNYSKVLVYDHWPGRGGQVSGTLYIYDSTGKLKQIGDSVFDYKVYPGNIDVNSLKLYYDVKLNEEGYPEYNARALYSPFLIYDSIPFDRGYYINYAYEYVNGMFTYDGRKQIKRIIKWPKSDDPRIWLIDYDKYGRISKVEKILHKTLRDNNEFWEYYLIYSKNSLYILKVDNLDNYNCLYLYCRQFDRYGNLIGFTKNGEDIYHKYKEYADAYDIETLKKKIKEINLSKWGYNGYHYKKSNPKYNENLKLQVTTLEDYKLTEYFLGITSWYRYKYLHDLTTDD